MPRPIPTHLPRTRPADPTKQIQRRLNPDIYLQAFKDQLKDHEKEIQEEIKDPSFKIPLQQEGADILYVPLSGLHTIIPAAKIFHAAKENWTLSIFEASNYGYLIGDTDRALKIAEPILEEARRMKVKKIVVSECGHAYRVMKHYFEF